MKDFAVLSLKLTLFFRGIASHIWKETLFVYLIILLMILNVFGYEK